MAPPVPINLSFKTNSFGQTVLSWSPSAGAVSYNVYGRTNPFDPYTTPLNSSPITSTSFIDTGYIVGSVEYYTVVSVDGTGASLPSATLMADSRTQTQVLPRVDFHQEKFDKFIQEKGYRLRREKALVCPCNRAGLSPTNGQDIQCPLCKGKRYIYFPDKQISAIVSNMTQDNTLEQSGQWLSGIYKITTKPQDQLGLYDRLIFVDDSVSFTEALVRGSTGTIDTPRYPALSFDLPIEDAGGVKYVEGTDFSVNSDGNIVWGLSAKSPAAGSYYGVRYQTLRRMLIVDFPHVQRATFRGDPPVYEKLSLAAVGKIEFMLE